MHDPSFYPGWLRAVEFMDDYRRIGRGMGGWRDDHQYDDTNAGI